MTGRFALAAYIRHESPCERVHDVMNGLEHLQCNTKCWVKTVKHVKLMYNAIACLKQKMNSCDRTRAQMISVIANVIRLGEFDMLWDSVFAEFGYLVKVLLLSRGVHIT